MKKKFVVNGRDDQKATIDSIFAQNRKRIYKEDTLEEYIDRVHKMNLYDFNAHCIEMGIKPNMTRDTLTQKLRRKFIETKSTFSSATGEYESEVKDKEKISRILNRQKYE